MSVVYAVNNGTSKCKAMMSLIRRLFHFAAQYSFDLRLVFIAGKDNIRADLLSRLRVSEFLTVHPSADASLTEIPRF